MARTRAELAIALGIITGCALAMARRVDAELIGQAALPTLVESAELIVIGEVAPPSPPLTDASIRIVRVLKGSAPGASLTFRWHQPVPDYAGTASHYGLLFLAREGTSGWSVLSLGGEFGLSGQMIFSPREELPTGYTSPKNAAVLDRVVGELRFAATDVDHPLHIAGAYALLLTLDLGPRPHGRPAGPAATSTADGGSSQTAVAIRTAGADLARVIHERVANGLDVPPPLARLLGLAHGADARDLGPLTSWPADDLTRQSAVYALRALQSASALEYLAAALDSGDEEIVYQGVMGLAEYALSQNSDPERHQVLSHHAPSFALFQKDPATYVEFWRRWWSCEACAVGHAACDRLACR